MQPYEQLKKAYTIQVTENQAFVHENFNICLLYTSPSPRD